MKKWDFCYEGIKGRAERTPNACFIVWGGMGFHLEAANKPLRAAILRAEPAA